MGSELTASADALDLTEFDWIWGLRHLEGGAGPELVEAFGQAVTRHLIGRADESQPWGWKSPHAHLLIPFLTERFPALRFVHVVGDARAAALVQDQPQLYRYGRLAGLVPDGDKLPDRLRFWAWANRRAAESGARLLGDRYLRVRLEDLCAEPERALENLSEFSGDALDARLTTLVPAPAQLGRDASVRPPPATTALLARFGYGRPTGAAGSREAVRIANLTAEVTRLIGPAPERRSWPTVSMLVPTHNGRELLSGLLHGLATSTDYPEFELIVVDNASSDGTLEWLAAQALRFPLIPVRNARNRSFSAAMNIGAARAAGELLLFLNNDVEPLEPTWLRRLVASLERPGTAIAGAVLVDPRRRSAGGRAVSVHHAGIALHRDGNVLRPVLQGRGADVSELIGPDREPAAVSAACSLVRKRQFDEVGGFEEGFRYGGEDFDLCLKLAERGGRVTLSRCTVLLHRPLSTRRSTPGGARESIAANHTLLLERWGPALKREYALDRAEGRRTWNDDGGTATAGTSYCVKAGATSTEAEMRELLEAITAAGYPAHAADGTDAWLLDDVVVHVFDGAGRYPLSPGRLNVLLCARGTPSASEAAQYDLVVPPEAAVGDLIEGAESLLARSGGPRRIGARGARSGRRARGAAAPPPRVVVVLGMARTGTSATMRILNILGVEVGQEEHLLAPIEDVNEKGFFEHYEIMRLNSVLLRRLGGSWHEPPPMPAGWESDRRLGGLRARAAAIIRKDFGDKPLWGFKDPRTCLTLPFWRPLIGPAAFVICHRHPLEIAGSLERRDGLSTEQSVALWRRYTASAIAATADDPRMIVSYRALLDDPHAVSEDLATFLDCGRGVANRAEIDGWLDHGLRHHERTQLDLLQDPHLEPLDTSLATLLELAGRTRRGAGDEQELADALNATARRLLASFQK
jgi:GT2 family glycosyltransferase